MHHKIVLIDEQVALIGGLNIADKYSGYHGETAWLDFGVEVTGLICKDIKRICESVWPKHIIKKLWNELPRTATTIDGSTTLRLLQNDWWRRRIEISAFYKDAIMHAQHEIIIAASYFFPGNRIRKQLQQAHKRGVRIRLLLAGRSDVILLKPAIRYLYDWLLRNEIEIYEWQPSVMHGKMAIIDRQLTTIGSYNLNALSDYGSMELNVLAANESFSKMCGDKLDQLIQSGTKQITFQEFKRSSNLVLRFYRWFSYQLIRSSLAVLFIFMQRSRMLNRIPN
jgi:cardiolipin synthase